MERFPRPAVVAGGGYRTGDINPVTHPAVQRCNLRSHLRKRGTRVAAVMVRYCVRWPFPLAMARPLFRAARQNFGLAIASLSPDNFPDLFGPVADTPHMEGVRGMGAFVLVTCVVRNLQENFILLNHLGTGPN